MQNLLKPIELVSQKFS